MANTLTNYVPDILKMGMMALREECVMPRLINTDYSGEVVRKGSTIDVPIPSAVTANNVTPGTATSTDINPTTRAISLSNWKETGFVLSDKELKEVENGVLPMQASEAIKGLANAVNVSCYNLFTALYRATGTSGTTPDAVSDVTDARKALNQELAPKSDRRFIWTSEAEAKMLQLNLFVAANTRGNALAITEGQMGRVLGFDHYHDQAIDDIAFDSTPPSAWDVNQADVAIGDTTVTLDGGTNNIQVGDVFTVAGDTQQYVATAALAAAAGDLSFYPPAKVAWADAAELTFFGDQAEVNLAFHRDCFSLAVRPLETPSGLGVLAQTIVDPVSKLALRLEVSRPHKQTIWTYDILWGVACTRPEFGVRVSG
jgi:hypothetical protein